MVATRLIERLRARGVDPHAAEDIVQEVATRTLVRDVPYDSADDLTRWAWTVARNLSVDHHRAMARVSVGTIPERAAHEDVVSIVEHRSRLRAVRRGLDRLRDSDRDAVVDAVNGVPPARGEAARVGMQRLRARGRLLHIVEGIAGAAGVAWGARRLLRVRHAAMAACAVPVVLILFTTLRGFQPLHDGTLDGRHDGATVQFSARTAARVYGVPLVAPAAHAPAGATPGAATASPSPRYFARIEQKAPNGETLAVRTRERTDTDAIVCIERDDTGRICVNPPRPPLP